MSFTTPLQYIENDKGETLFEIMYIEYANNERPRYVYIYETKKTGSNFKYGTKDQNFKRALIYWNEGKPYIKYKGAKHSLTPE